MTTEWAWKMYLIIREVDNTTDSQRDFGEAFSDNGSGETVANEAKAFDYSTRFSSDGNEPAVALAINTSVKTNMRQAIKDIIDALTSARYITVDYDTEQMISNNFGLANNRVVTWDDFVGFIASEFGLIVIEG